MDDFAHNDHRSQTPFGLVVGRGHMVAAEAGEEVLLLRSQQPFAKGFRFGMAQGILTEPSELAAQRALLFFGAFGAPRFPGKSAMDLASVMDKALDALTKQACFGIGGPAFEQR